MLLNANTSASSGDNQAWSALLVNGSVSSQSDLLFWFDGHARFRDDAGELGVSILRPGIGWRMNTNLSLWAGYARVTIQQPGANIDEDRLWQQATYPMGSLFGGSVSGRSRLEQRRRNTGDQTGHRFRQFVRWSRPLQSPSLTAIVWAEAFIGLNDTDWGQADGLDQNRLFVGVGWQTFPRLRLEAGYLHNYLNLSPGQTNHNLSVSLAVKL